MILFDTNIFSELWRPSPDPRCMAWANAQPVASIHACAPVLAALLSGIHLIPEGRRQARLIEEYGHLVSRVLVAPVLAFGKECVPAYAGLLASQAGRARGERPIDLMIAAIALTHDLTLATRNVRDFEGMGVRLVNPFEA